MAAITAANLTTSNDSVNRSTYTTASISPTAGRLIIAAVSSEVSGTPNEPTLSGNSLTWTSINTITSSNNRTTVYRALTAGATSGTVSISLGGQTQDRCHWSIVEFQNTVLTGTNGADAIVQSVTNSGTGTSGSVTLGAFGSGNNATYGVFRISAQESVSPGSGFTELGESQGDTRTIQTEYRADADTSVDASWTSNVSFRAIALEIKAPSTAGFFMFM